MIFELICCLLLASAVLVYVFSLPHRLYVGSNTTRASYLRERKDAVYENLRDLNFEYRAGKYPEEDFQTQRALLENEAAQLLAEIELLQQM